ncbi:34891_t:CDS:2, partial [Racocetra persica]
MAVHKKFVEFPLIFFLSYIEHTRKSLVKFSICHNILIVILLIEFLIIWWIRKFKHSYLYTDPYEPIVHETFGVDEAGLWNIIVQTIYDFFVEIMTGGHEFGHSDYD